MMTYGILGALLFATPHLFSILFPETRNSLRTGLGEAAWKGLYSVASLAGIVLFVLAYRAMGEGSGGDALYTPWAGAKHLALLAVLLTFILFGAAQGKGYIKHYVRHPFSLGIALWAGSHLLANSERAVVWLFGTILVVALADLVFSFARGKRPDHVPEVKSDIRAVVIGVVLYLVFLFGFHPYILGVPVVGG
jgi:uncharacterized membrane protein